MVIRPQSTYYLQNILIEGIFERSTMFRWLYLKVSMYSRNITNITLEDKYWNAVFTWNVGVLQQVLKIHGIPAWIQIVSSNDLIVILTLPDRELCFDFSSSSVVCGGFQTHTTQNATEFFLSYIASDKENMIQYYNNNNNNMVLYAHQSFFLLFYCHINSEQYIDNIQMRKLKPKETVICLNL